MRLLSTLFVGLCLVVASVHLASAAPKPSPLCAPAVAIGSPANGPGMVASPMIVSGTFTNGGANAVISITFKNRATGMVVLGTQAYGDACTGNWATVVNVPAGNYDITATIIQTTASSTVTDITVP